MSLDSAHAPRKRFGQHFLADRRVIDDIVLAIAPASGERIVEIGPGEGALTFALLERVRPLIAIELDRDLVPLLRARADASVLEVIEADALGVDYRRLRGDGPRLRLVGNLPYNISTPLLFHLLDHADAIADMHFMLQKEVVDRICAAPGGKTFGRLSVMLGARARAEALLEVPPSAFRPPPKVESAVVRIVPHPAAAIAAIDFAALGTLVAAGFQMRRKTIANALSRVADRATIDEAGIDPGARAETIAIDQWLRLATRVAARPMSPH